MAEAEIKKYVDPHGNTHLFEERRDASSVFRTYYGRTLNLGAAQTDPVWQIYAEDQIGSLFQRQWASGDRNFNKQWNLRTTYFGAVSFLNSYSLQLSGAVNSYCTVPDNATLDFNNTDGFSGFIWVKLTNTALQMICQKASATSGNNGYTLQIDGSQRIVFLFRGASGTDQLEVRTATLATIVNGSWHLIGWTKASGSAAASTAKIYYDGVSQALTTVTDTLTGTTTNASILALGANIAGGARLTANVDEFAIWNAGLTGAEVTAIYNTNAGVIDLEAGSGQIASALVSWWRMGDGEFTALPTIPDDKGTNDMTAQAAITTGDLESEVPP